MWKEERPSGSNGRREFLHRGGLGLGAWAAASLFGTGAVGAVIARPAIAAMGDESVLRVGRSLELLAVETYERALALPLTDTANTFLREFMTASLARHREHSAAFAAQGGRAANGPNAQYKAIIDRDFPTAQSLVDVVVLLTRLEKVLVDTYTMSLFSLREEEAKKILASVLGVTAQHLTVLRLAESLMRSGSEALLAPPTDVAKLPGSTVPAALPTALEVVGPDGTAVGS